MTRLFNIRFVLFAALALLGCDSGVTSGSEVQYVSEVQWRPGGSSMVGFVQYFVATATVPDPGEAYQITRIDGNGKIGAAYNTKERAIRDYYYSIFFTIFITADDQAAIAQLGRNVYRIDLAGGQEQELLVDFHPAAASADGRFIIGSHSQIRQLTKKISVYDLASDPPRTVLEFDIDSLANTSGLWLNNGQFALTISDSVGFHVDIYDTTGALKYRVGSARTPTHNAKFIGATNHLYYRENQGTLGMLDLNTGLSSQFIHFEVLNFDMTADEKTLYYTMHDGDKTILMKQDLISGTESQLADNVIWGAFLSPDERKIAYVYDNKTNFQEIKVIDLP